MAKLAKLETVIVEHEAMPVVDLPKPSAVLPAGHIADSAWFVKYVSAWEITPRFCHVLKKRLVYLYYGGLFFRRDTAPTRQAAMYPVGFLFNAEVLKQVMHFYPFDTGALVGPFYGDTEEIESRWTDCGFRASRSAFRDEADHDSGMMPISVPTRCRSLIGRFRNRDRNVGIGLRRPPATPVRRTSRALSATERATLDSRAPRCPPLMSGGNIVPQPRLSMRKIKEVLRLHYELGLGQHQIARCCSISQSTVHGYLKRAESASLSWPLPPDCDEAQLEERLFGRRVAGPPGQRRVEPDFAAIHEQLQTHKHVTLQLLWEEYIEADPEGYRYSRFCELYQRWRPARRCFAPATPRRRKAFRRLRRGDRSRREPAVG